ncbi:MAG: cysteine--tRNA ligase [Pseudoclavibacter sp.]|nr:cysteine--tRNA ligase [Pseudoclavibacter sp.]
MTQRLYDSRTRTLHDFEPRVPGAVSMYVCGPTVQSGPHIGHLRSALAYDQIRRWLLHEGHRVVFVRNVTDIDDKTLAGASEHEPWWALAYRVELEFQAAYRALRILPPSYEPRATASIMEMQALIARLVERGHAYPAADGSGDVYFDTASWPDYGELTRQRAEEMAAAEDSASAAKRDPRDFALWKGRKPGEPDSAAWPSPWGAGRPGWHIECSAMSTRYLGESFDIHGGGLDLRFPHHENELAQSRAAGHEFARYWLHNGLVHLTGQKMSKSIGNVVTAAELLASARPIAVRYALGSAHYRSVIEFSPDSLAEAEAAVRRVEAFLRRVDGPAGQRGDEPSGEAKPGEANEAFRTAMRDDFAVPQALAAVHAEITRGNQAADAGDADAARRAAADVRTMLGVLGLDPSAPEWRDGAGDDAAASALGTLVERLLERRRRARQERDFAAADGIRDLLAEAGVRLADSPEGTEWSV